MNADIDPEEVMANLTDEITRAPPMLINMGPADAFALVAMLQLALRHPGVNDGPGAADNARSFIKDVQDFYSEYPTIVQVIDMGFDTRFDARSDLC